MQPRFQLRVRKPVEFVREALRCFQPSCLISLEGDLSQSDLACVPGALTEATDVLKRNTLFPKQEFVILPVTSETRDVISRQILPQIGLKQRVLHVQVSHD